MLSTNVAAIFVFMLILSPVLIPAAVAVVHAIGTGASNLTAIARTFGLRLRRPALQPAA